MDNPGSLHPKFNNSLSAYPKVAIGNAPTPLEFLPNLSSVKGRPIWIKRDDLFGPLPGGNKFRTLEYLLGEAVNLAAQRLVTFGAMQSNHVRMTAAAGGRLRLPTHIFCFEPRPKRLEGNMLLNSLYGARVHFVPIGGGGRMRLETANRIVRWLSRLSVGPSYFIPAGGHSWIGGLGYAAAALEIDAQARARGIGRAFLIQGVGTGGTLAGLMAGLTIIESDLQLIGIDVGKLWRAFPQSIAGIANALCAQLGYFHNFDPSSVPLIEERYAGDRYGIPSPEGTAAQRLLARREGILLDPVYTAKAFAGLLDLNDKGVLDDNTPLIFLHTGGLPGIFAFNQQVGS